MSPRAEAVARWFDGQASAYEGWDRGPFAGVREREARAVIAAVGDVAGVDVLELGCGSGRFTRRLLDGGAASVTVVDLSSAMLSRLPSARVVAVHGDAADVDLHRTFPVLLSAGMLEFVPDAGAVLANAARHAAAGARFVLLVPRAGLLGRLYRRWHGRHGVAVRLFDVATIATLAAANGWRVTTIDRAPPFGHVVELAR